jgi:hypothetical protein
MIPLHQSSQSDIDEIENLINASVKYGRRRWILLLMI